jgi:hypothetical protein
MTRDEFNTLAATWPDADFWSHSEDCEHLSHSDPTEELQEALEGWYSKGQLAEDMIREDFSDGVEIFGWRQKPVTDEHILHLRDVAVEAILEALVEDCELGNFEDGEKPHGLPALIEAAVREDMKTRHVYQCERECKIELSYDQVVGIAKLEWPEMFNVDQ